MASTSSSAAAAASDSPRKGRHARSQAMVNSVSAMSSSSTSTDRRGSLLGGASSALGLPPGVDPLTLDADEALMRFSVREAHAIEASLRASHDSLTTRLRTLVSERYRDMLGTANTLIEMSASSTNLVQRLDSVLDGVERAGKVAAAADDGGGSGSSGLTGLFVAESEAHDVATQQQSKARAALFAVAATTKLIAEAPDEVWKAVDAATQASETGVVTATTSTSKKQALKGRELSDFQAATMLRAAWIFTLAEASWAWLASPTLHSDDQQLDADQQFPFVARQRTALMPMRSFIVSACTTGLSGWMDGPSTSASSNTARWDDVSASYLATITSLISLALLEGLSLQAARERLLQRRAATLQARLRSARSTTSHGETLVHVVHFVSDTLLHTLKAFALPPSESATPKQPHLAALYARLLRPDDESTPSYPPLALSVLHTLPSAAILTQHLPEAVRMYAPPLVDDDSEALPDDTLFAVQEWASNVLNDGLNDALSRIADSLTTIAAISEMQSTIWASADRCCAQARKTCRVGDAKKGDACAAMVEETLHALVARIDGLLMRRLNSICQTYGDQLSSAVIEGTREALQHFDSTNGVASEAEEVEPAQFLFESSMSVDGSTLEALERKLRIRTKHVQDILTLAEEKATAFASETRAYSSSMRRAEARRVARRRAQLQRESSGDAAKAGEGEHAAEQGRRESGQEMLASFDASLRRAKKAIVEALRQIADELVQDEKATTTARLFLARLVSALRQSSVFVSKHAASDKGDEQGLAKDLQVVQRSLLDAWVTHVVDEANKTYMARCDANIKESTALPQTASVALLDALAALTRGVQAVGVGYRSESTWLRSRLTAAFAVQWLKSDSVTASPQHLFDVETLAALAGLRDTADDDVVLNSDRAAAQTALREARTEALRTIGLDDRQWSVHCATQLQATLARVRLIVAGIAVDESLFAAANTSSGKGPPTTASVPPPLPMLRLAKAREAIPRIRPMASR